MVCWWEADTTEKYWLEITDRDDLGANLKAPLTNEKNKPFWSYSLLKMVNRGDVIFHYEKSKKAITSFSICEGSYWLDLIFWGSRGVLARREGIQPHERQGHYMGLSDFQLLNKKVSIKDILAQKAEIIGLKENLETSLEGTPSLYFPFELGPNRPPRALQGYLFKFPKFMLDVFPQLSSSFVGSQSFKRSTKPELGTLYRFADQVSPGKIDPFTVDPAIIERGLSGHANTQNSLAKELTKMGIDPRSPAPKEPNYDLGWSFKGHTWVCEVKSITDSNEEKQLRLGLGQLLRYRHQLKAHYSSVKAVLAVERRPLDDTWVDLCESLQVYLVWPEFYKILLK